MSSLEFQKSCQEAINTYYKNNKNIQLASNELGISRTTFKYRLDTAQNVLKLSPGKLSVDNPKTQRILNLEREVSQLRTINSKLTETVSGLEDVKRLIHKIDVSRRPPKWLVPKESKHTVGIPTLFCSDFHYDEIVHPNEINGVNSFNRSIAQKRIKTLFVETVDLLINRVSQPKYDRIVVSFGGDLLSGNIHEDLRENNEAPIAKSLISLLDNLIAGLLLLLDHFPFIEVNCVPGNHGRFDRKPRYKHSVFDNYEWILHQFLKRHFQGEDRIHFNIADGADLPYTLYKTRYLLTHGDQFKGGSGISGALSPLMLGDHRKRKRSMAIDQPYDYMLMGHFHQMIFVKGIIVNGSLKGYDEYAYQNNFEFELPIQSLWVTNPTYGITMRWPIYLEKPGVRF